MRIRIRDIVVSNLGADTGYPDLIRGFPRSHQSSAAIILYTMLHQFPCRFIPNRYLLRIILFDAI
jgi:hypothetical protein